MSYLDPKQFAPRALAALLALGLALPSPAAALRQEPPVEGDPQTAAGLEERLRAPTPKPAAGLEEDSWIDIRWFWEMEPWQRQQLLHGVPGQPGFYFNGQQQKKQAQPGIEGLVEAWPDHMRADSGSAWWHVEQEDLFKHLVDAEFNGWDAPWAEPFRRGVQAIRDGEGSTQTRAARLIAYLKFLSLMERQGSFNPEYLKSLRQFAELSRDRLCNFGWGNYRYLDTVILRFAEAHRDSPESLGRGLAREVAYQRWRSADGDLAYWLLPMISSNDGEAEEFMGAFIDLVQRELDPGDPLYPHHHLRDYIDSAHSRQRSNPWLPGPVFPWAQEWISSGRMTRLQAALAILITGTADTSSDSVILGILNGIGGWLDAGKIRGEDIYYLLGVAVENSPSEHLLLALVSLFEKDLIRSEDLRQLARLQTHLPRHQQEKDEALPDAWFLLCRLLETGALLREDISPLAALGAAAANPRAELAACLQLLDERVLRREDLRVLAEVVSAPAEPSQVQFIRAALSAHPEWAAGLPDAGEMRRFRRGLSLLPPSGGKIPLIQLPGGATSEPHTLLPPTAIAEEQAGIVLRRRQAGVLGKAYVHQTTVQGKLPDEFKYAAVALILSSPYRQDWLNPFFEAAWGTVAPLVHDGGVADLGLNPRWKRVRGRTDFLQRVVKVYGPDEPELQGMEDERLLLESRAYQRLALALHAARGTAPQAPGVPRGLTEELRTRLAGRWESFRIRMDHLLGEFGVAGAVRVRWFNEEPGSALGYNQGRYEAEWAPIQEELLRLNQLAEDDLGLYNGLRVQVVSLLQQVADAIDRDIGLLPPEGPAAGLEELPESVRRPLEAMEIPGLKADARRRLMDEAMDAAAGELADGDKRWEQVALAIGRVLTEDKRVVTRRHAAFCLGLTGHRAALEPLAQVLGMPSDSGWDPSEGVRTRALRALTRLQYEEPAELTFVMKALTYVSRADPEREVRAYAEKMRWAFGPRCSLVRQVWAAGTVERRAWALQKLGELKLGAGESAAALRTAIRREDNADQTIRLLKAMVALFPQMGLERPKEERFTHDWLRNLRYKFPGNRRFRKSVAHAVARLNDAAAGAGLEETAFRTRLGELAEAAQGPGVLVVGARVLAERPTLRELMRRLPELAERVILFDGNRAGLVAELLRGDSRADQVSVLGDPELADFLEGTLPAGMEVTPLLMDTPFRYILAALGVPEEALYQVDTEELEGQLSKLRSA